MPSPQRRCVQSVRQAASGASLFAAPSSRVQSGSQVEEAPPSSQASSARLFQIPSPHVAGVQSSSQSGEKPASSQASPGPTKPSPQRWSRQLLVQLASSAFRSPSSQS